VPLVILAAGVMAAAAAAAGAAGAEGGGVDDDDAMLAGLAARMMTAAGVTLSSVTAAVAVFATALVLYLTYVCGVIRQISVYLGIHVLTIGRRRSIVVPSGPAGSDVVAGEGSKAALLGALAAQSRVQGNKARSESSHTGGTWAGKKES